MVQQARGHAKYMKVAIGMVEQVLKIIEEGGLNVNRLQCERLTNKNLRDQYITNDPSISLVNYQEGRKQGSIE